LKNKDLWVIISMMVLCNANVITEHDRRRSAWLPNPSAPLGIEYDNNSIEITDVTDTEI